MNTQQPKSPRNPKLRLGSRSTLFPYYAGFNSEFVADVISELKMSEGNILLDPWNGSGTTTTTGLARGLNVTGIDVNPVMVIAGRAAILDTSVVNSIAPLAEDIIRVASIEDFCVNSDPLDTWLAPSSAHTLRALYRAIIRVLVSPEAIEQSITNSIETLSSIACFYLTALMRTSRTLAHKFTGSNPTWTLKPELSKRLRPSREKIFSYFLDQSRSMSNSLSLSDNYRSNKANIFLHTSTKLPIASESVDAVITSPPYLTRIDYAVATSVELASLGIDSISLRNLRNSMLGTPTVSKIHFDSSKYGNICCSFLDTVAEHPTKASRTYYLKVFQQYLEGMHSSLSEISRTLKPGAASIFVVQNSYYKDVNIDLAGFVLELSQKFSMRLYKRDDFPSSRNIANINRYSRRYCSARPVIESVLWLRKHEDTRS